MSNTLYCPICSSDKLEQLYIVKSSFVSDQLIPASEPEKHKRCKLKIEDIWSANEASYYTCKSCSFDFSHPFIAADSELYSLIYSSESQYPSTKWEYSVTLGSIEKYSKNLSGIPVLFEIGAGNGSFLRLVLNKGIPSENIVATEFSQAGVKAISLLGIKCFNKDLKSISSEDISGKINIICLFQVLEHLSDIHNFFLKINEFTNPGARLYISVPNYYQRRFYDTFNLNYDLPPIHVGRYNANSLGVLAMAFGWKILQNKIQPSTYAERVKKFLYSRFDSWQRYWATEKLGIKILRLFLRYSLYLLITLVYIRLIAGLKRADLGTAQWFELERIK